MKRPFISIKETFFENLDKVKENQRQNFSNLEKMMIWIVGFSIGGLSIIITNLTEFNQSFSDCVVQTVLTLLTTSIISGIIYRLAFYYYQITYQGLEFYLQGAFSDKELMSIDPEDLINETDVKEIIRRIKNDFGEDVSQILSVYDQLNNEGKTFIKNDLKNHYQKLGEWAKKDFEFGMDYVKDVYKTAFGLSKKRIEKMFQSNYANKLKVFGWITSISLIISILSFASVLIILCVSYN